MLDGVVNMAKPLWNQTVLRGDVRVCAQQHLRAVMIVSNLADLGSRRTFVQICEQALVAKFVGPAELGSKRHNL
jgi:hypothetical protein